MARPNSYAPQSTMPTFEIIAIVLLAIANGVFAMSEIAVVSSRKARLQALAEEGSRKARVALELANNPNDFLSTVQIGITVISTLAGVFGGATLAGYLTASLNSVPWISPHGESVALGLVVVGISYLSLVVGELVPKRIGLSNPERYASFLAPFMRVLARVASPAVRFLSWSTDIVIRFIPMKHEEQQTVTEQDMVEGVFRLGDRRVSELMTPRQEIDWIDTKTGPEETREALRQSKYSRFPVAHGDLDFLKGFVHVKDLLDESLDGKPLDIQSLLRRAPVIPESMFALKALETLQRANSHLAFIVNEHGGVEGLVTVTDIMQAIVGSVPASSADNEPLAVKRDDGSWLIDGTMQVYEFKDLLDLRKLAGEQDGSFTTVGGFVMTSLGKVPAAGDHFEHDGWRYEVMDMDGNRVDK